MEDLGVKATNLASEASSAEASGSLQEAVNLHFQAAQAFLHASTYATDASLARQWKLASQDHATAGKKLNKKLAKASSKKKDSSKKKHNKGSSSNSSSSAASPSTPSRGQSSSSSTTTTTTTTTTTIDNTTTTPSTVSASIKPIQDSTSSSTLVLVGAGGPSVAPGSAPAAQSGAPPLTPLIDTFVGQTGGSDLPPRAPGPSLASRSRHSSSSNLATSTAEVQRMLFDEPPPTVVPQDGPAVFAPSTSSSPAASTTAISTPPTSMPSSNSSSRASTPPVLVDSRPTSANTSPIHPSQSVYAPPSSIAQSAAQPRSPPAHPQGKVQLGAAISAVRKPLSRLWSRIEAVVESLPRPSFENTPLSPNSIRARRTVRFGSSGPRFSLPVTTSRAPPQTRTIEQQQQKQLGSAGQRGGNDDEPTIRVLDSSAWPGVDAGMDEETSAKMLASLHVVPNYTREGGMSAYNPRASMMSGNSSGASSGHSASTSPSSSMSAQDVAALTRTLKTTQDALHRLEGDHTALLASIANGSGKSSADRVMVNKIAYLESELQAANARAEAAEAAQQAALVLEEENDTLRNSVWTLREEVGRVIEEEAAAANDSADVEALKESLAAARAENVRLTAALKEEQERSATQKEALAKHQARWERLRASAREKRRGTSSSMISDSTPTGSMISASGSLTSSRVASSDPARTPVGAATSTAAAVIVSAGAATRGSQVPVPLASAELQTVPLDPGAFGAVTEAAPLSGAPPLSQSMSSSVPAPSSKPLTSSVTSSSDHGEGAPDKKAAPPSIQLPASDSSPRVVATSDADGDDETVTLPDFDIPDVIPAFAPDSTPRSPTAAAVNTLRAEGTGASHSPRSDPGASTVSISASTTSSLPSVYYSVDLGASQDPTPPQP